MFEERNISSLVVAIAIFIYFVAMPQSRLNASERELPLSCPQLEILERQLSALEITNIAAQLDLKRITDELEKTKYIAERDAVVDEIHQSEGSIALPGKPIISLRVNNERYTISNMGNMPRKVRFICCDVGDLVNAELIVVELDDGDLTQRWTEAVGIMYKTSETIKRLRYMEKPRIRWQCEQNLHWRRKSGA